MSDSYSISYSFQQEPPRPGATSAELYAVDDFTTCPLAQGTLVVGRSTGNRLAMQPSIVAALFIYAAWVTTFGIDRNGFAVSLSLVLLMIPTVVRSTEEMLKLVPNELREAS